MQSGAGAVGDPRAGVQFTVGVVPSARGGQHAAVVDTALRVEERAAVARDEIVGHLAPLRGSLDVADQLARAEHVTAGEYDRVEGQPLAGQRGGHRLVDQREPGVGQALAHPDQAELRRGDQLEIHVASRPGHPHRPPGELLGLVQVGHPVGPGQPYPAVHRPGVERLQQPFGPDHPAVGRGEVREVRLVRNRQPHRAPRRALDVARGPVQRVGPAVPVDARAVLAQPPQRHRQPEARLSGLGLATGQRRLESGARLFPPSLGQGGGAVGDRSGRCHASIVTGSARR